MDVALRRASTAPHPQPRTPGLAGLRRGEELLRDDPEDHPEKEREAGGGVEEGEAQLQRAFAAGKLQAEVRRVFPPQES